MRNISVVLLAIAVIAGMSAASAQDTAAPKQNPSFQKADTNGDGVLSTEEYQAAVKRMKKQQRQRPAAKPNSQEGQQCPLGSPPEGRGQGRGGYGRGPQGSEGKGYGRGPQGGEGQGYGRGARGPQGPGGPGGGPHRMLQKADTNKDGQISRKEFAKAMPNAPEDAFSRMDRNGDGILNREDRPEDGQGRRGGRRGPQGDPGQRMRAMDTDQDGSISPEEFTAGHPNAPEDAFSRMDTNGDGVLNKEDFQGREGGYGRQGRRGGPQGDPRQRMRAMDTDQDGNITADEFAAGHPNAPEDAFSHMDTNGDGVLNKEDFKGRERPYGRRGERRGPPPAPASETE